MEEGALPFYRLMNVLRDAVVEGSVKRTTVNNPLVVIYAHINWEGHSPE